MAIALPLTRRLEAQARRAPHRIALGDGQQSRDYGDIWTRAGRVAAWLRSVGVAPGDRVALILGNGPDIAAAWHGAWRAGAVVVPLNAQARSRDFRAWLQHSGARALLHDDPADLAATLDALDPVPAVQALAPLAAQGDDDDHADAALDPDALAAILYTSGTTGAPKGVMLSHGNLAANTDAIVACLGLRDDDVTVTALPHYYAFGASVLHTHLAAGARVVYEPNLVFPQAIPAAIARERATGFAGVPSGYALLLDRGQLDQHDLSSLRTLAQAGGALAPVLAQRLRTALPQARLVVMYGQTEASARLSWLPPERLADKLGSVGIAIPGVELAVHRDDGSIAAPGEDGEVRARGANIMRGYWRDPEASARALVDGWLRTGDLGHLDGDGFLWLAGRRSDLIKTGAHRVHPQDVEEAIAELPGVAEVAVAGVDDALLGQVVACWIVPVDGAAPTPMQVKAHCRERLAAYKIPKHVHLVAALPKTASGKIRRAELADRTRTDGP